MIPKSGIQKPADTRVNPASDSIPPVDQTHKTEMAMPSASNPMATMEFRRKGIEELCPIPRGIPPIRRQFMNSTFFKLAKP